MLRALVVWVNVCLIAVAAFAQNAIPVTYQGTLSDEGRPADGEYDFRFTVFDDPTAGAAIAGPQAFFGVMVRGGLFQVELSYPRDGRANESRWLEIETRPAGAATFEALTPRQRITPAPEAGNTQAARLQPDGRVLIGTGVDLGIGAGLDTVVLPSTFPIRDAQFVQTFVAEASGTPVLIGGLFNELPSAAVDVTAEVFTAGTPPTLVAAGLVTGATTGFTTITFDTVAGLLLCGEPYELVISYTLSANGLPASAAVTGGLSGDVYPFGEVVGRVGIDMVASLAVDRGATQVTVFDDGLALLNGGLIVGPDDAGDGGVVLPKGSVNPAEMLGEAGIVEPDVADPSDPANTLLAARVLAPADGFVMAIGSAEVTLVGFDGATLSLSSSTGSQFSRSAAAGLVSVIAQPSQTVRIPVTVHGVFPVSANEQVDIYLRGPSAFDAPLLNAMFVPSNYTAPAPLGP